MAKQKLFEVTYVDLGQTFKGSKSEVIRWIANIDSNPDYGPDEFEEDRLNAPHLVIVEL